MSIPNIILIGGHKITCLEEISRLLHEPKAGHANFWTNYIKYSNELDETVKEETVAHEILHHIINRSGVDSIIEEVKLNEEVLVRLLDNVFYRFLKDNTNFFNKMESKNK